MTPHEQDRLARTVFGHLAESVPSWREVPVAPDAPEELDGAPGYNRWHRERVRRGEARTRYESNRKLITDAGRHLEALGHRTTSIRSPRPGHVSVRVASAGSWRLCVRIPEEAAVRMLVLGFMPGV